MRWTLLLTIPAIVLSSVLGGGLGLRAGWKKGGLLDTIASPIMLFLNTIPTNCMAILFLMVFAFQMGLFPISGITSGGLSGLEKAVDILWHMALPLMILVILRTASYYMLMKSTVQTIRDEEYITVARGKGFSQGQVLRRHVLKNALCPYLTSVCMQFGHILGGSMLVEVVFSWKGTVSYTHLQSITNEEYEDQLCKEGTYQIFICYCTSGMASHTPLQTPADHRCPNCHPGYCQ